MRLIIWYLFQCIFCKHSWDYDEEQCLGFIKNGTRVSATCKFCGWHRSYWKF